MFVLTKNGPLARELLTVKDIINETATSREIATEWYLGDELVRRDGWVNMLTGHAVAPDQAQL